MCKSCACKWGYKCFILSCLHFQIISKSIFSHVSLLKDSTVEGRETKRTETKMERETTKVCQKEIRNTSSYSEKKTEGKDRHYKEERGKKRADATQRTRKSRLALTKKHELEKMLVDTVRQRKTERQRRWREKKHNESVVTYPIYTGETRNEFTFSKMSKCRANKKLKCALPRTPVKRVATVKAYLSCKKITNCAGTTETKGRSFTGGNQGCKIK